MSRLRVALFAVLLVPIFALAETPVPAVDPTPVVGSTPTDVDAPGVTNPIATPVMTPVPVPEQLPSPPSGTDLPEAPWYTTTTGIAGAVALIVSLLKRSIGGVSGLSDIPTWLYSVAVSVILTAGARLLFGAFSDGSWPLVLWNAGVSAAVASGFYSWYEHIGKPMSESSAPFRK